MKYLLLLLFFFLLFWYYKKIIIKSAFKKRKKSSGNAFVEMKVCEHCSAYFAEKEGIKVERGDKELFFCSEKCFKDYSEKSQFKEERGCSSPS